MGKVNTVIDRLVHPISDEDYQGLAALLMDAVESGAAVSFLATLTRDEAEVWWRKSLAAITSGLICLVAREKGSISGSVQLQPAWAPNQPHRAEIVKLLVHRSSRGKGLGRELMEAIQWHAQRAGYRLLTLDAKQGAVAETLYRQMGWDELGTISEYALDPDGKPHAAVFFYKRLTTGE